MGDKRKDESASVPSVFAAVDRCVYMLDCAQLGKRHAKGGTPSFETLTAQWRVFLACILRIDQAMRDPLSPSQAAVLCTASVFHEDDIDSLAFHITHVGDAIKRYRRPWSKPAGKPRRQP